MAWGIPPSDEIAAAGELLFRAEGAKVTNRRQWRAGSMPYMPDQKLYGCYVPPHAVPEGLALITRQLSLIDRLRLGSIPTTGFA